MYVFSSYMSLDIPYMSLYSIPFMSFPYPIYVLNQTVEDTAEANADIDRQKSEFKLLRVFMHIWASLCMCLYVCMYVQTYIHTYMHACIHMWHLCMHAYICDIYACMHTYVTSMHACMYVCLSVHTYIHVYTTGAQVGLIYCVNVCRPYA